MSKLFYTLCILALALLTKSAPMPLVDLEAGVDLGQANPVTVFDTPAFVGGEDEFENDNESHDYYNHHNQLDVNEVGHADLQFEMQYFGDWE